MRPHVRTLESIAIQHTPCGCHQRGGLWFLCAYHDGYQDALDELEDES